MNRFGTPLAQRFPLVFLIFGPLWAIGVAIWVILPMARLQAEKIEACTASTSATVLDYDGSYHSSGIIQYAVNGVSYNGAKLFGMNRSDVGTKITIHYDPRNPARFYAGEEAHFSWTGWVLGMVALIVGVSLIMVCAYFDAVRNRNRASVV